MDTGIFLVKKAALIKIVIFVVFHQENVKFVHLDFGENIVRMRVEIVHHISVVKAMGVAVHVKTDLAERIVHYNVILNIAPPVDVM